MCSHIGPDCNTILLCWGLLPLARWGLIFVDHAWLWISGFSLADVVLSCILEPAMTKPVDCTVHSSEWIFSLLCGELWCLYNCRCITVYIIVTFWPVWPKTLTIAHSCIVKFSLTWSTISHYSRHFVMQPDIHWEMTFCQALFTVCVSGTSETPAVICYCPVWGRGIPLPLLSIYFLIYSPFLLFSFPSPIYDL